MRFLPFEEMLRAFGKRLALTQPYGLASDNPSDKVPRLSKRVPQSRFRSIRSQ